MEIEVIDIIVFVTGIILGFVGALALKSKSQRSSQAKASHSSSAIEALQQDSERRQVIADDHFMQVNTQLTALDRKLSDLRRTLSVGASQLSGVSVSATSSIKVTEETLDTPDMDASQAPKDYANKPRNQAGTLSEGFGLHDEEDVKTPSK